MKYFIFLLAMWGAGAQARVFDINKESFAAYFMAGAGSSALGVTSIKDEGASGLTYTGGTNYNYSGEFGFIYSKSILSLRFGMEILKPTALESNVSSASTAYYAVQGDILGYAPKVALDVNLHGNSWSRSYISLAGGLANVTMKNQYTVTSAGGTALGVGDHTTESKGSGTLLAASLGYENLLTDTTTIVIEFGYRQLKVESLQYTKDVSTFGGNKSSGDTLKNVSGSDRSLDFSGGFAAIGFRFYL